MDQQQNQSPKQGFSLSSVTDVLVKILPIIAIVFLVLAVVAFMYYTIRGITAGSFTGFLNGLANAVSACASNVFMASVLAVLYKIGSKK